MHAVSGFDKMIAHASSLGHKSPVLLTVLDCCLSSLVLDPSDICLVIAS